VTTASWTPTKEDVRGAVRAARRSQPFVLRHVVRLTGALFVVVATVVIVVWGLPAGSLVGSGLGLLLFGAVFQDRAPWRNAYAQQPVEATLTADELTYRGTGAVRFASSWPWTAFRYAVETPDHFVLVGHRDERGFVPYLPKRALADPAAARAIIAGRLEVR
jgi:hypothetical protein